MPGPLANRGTMARRLIIPLMFTMLVAKGKRVMVYTMHLSEITLITAG